MEEVTNDNKTSDTKLPNAPEPIPQVQQNTDIQPPIETKDYKGKKNVAKIVIASLILLGLIIAGIVLNWNFFRLLFVNQNKTSQTTSTPTNEVAKPTDMASPTVSLGTQTIKVIPGLAQEKQHLLADGETRILFGSGGSSKAVPDIVFGQNYSLNDIHNINHLPIRNGVSFYNNGYFITLKNQGCNTETRFTDVPEVWVTDCTIQVTSGQEEALTKKLEPFNRAFNANTSFSGAITQPESPLIYLTMPKLSIQNFSTPQSSENVSLQAGSMTSYSTSTAWDIQIISSYGIETIRYTAQEVWDKETKQVTTGPLTSVSKIDNLDCKVIFTGDEGQQTERCEVTVNMSFGQDEANLLPIKLSSYTQ
ncbi:hypothetical protein ACFL0Y_00950 [Patescibacteria group bacterium]